MFICSYMSANGPRHGVVEDDTTYQLEGDLFGGTAIRGSKIGTIASTSLLPPVAPSKIMCIGRNYAAHAQERGEDVPTEPLLFLKPPSALIGNGQAIELLRGMGRAEHEAELAVVIGREGRFIRREDALSYVFGYTCANDVSARDYQAKDGQWSRAKGFDTFCPLGPWLATDLDPANVFVRCRVNNELRQNGLTSELVFDVPFLIAHISRIMTLYPGDVILTGTPAGVSPIKAGDVVEVEVDGIGTLRNPVSEVNPDE